MIELYLYYVNIIENGKIVLPSQREHNEINAFPVLFLMCDKNQKIMS